MKLISKILSLFRALLRRGRIEQEMAAELRFHIESRADDLARSGVPREEALRRARIEFGSVEAHKEEIRASVGLRLWDELRADVRYAVRISARNPGFTAVAVVTLALGIGANTAIFTLIDALLLRRLPVHKAEQLFQVRIADPGGSEPVPIFTYPLWQELSTRQDVFSGMAAWSHNRMDLSSGGTVRAVDGMWVSGNHFETLGVRPAAGRLISPADDRRGCPGAAVLSYAYWQARYAGAPSAVGSTITLDRHSFEVIGVAAAGFHGATVGSKFDVALPLCATALYDGARPRLDRRSSWWLLVMGRVRPGLAAEQVQARLAALSPAAFAAAVPQDWGADGQQRFMRRRYVAAPAGSGTSWLRQRFQQPLAVLMAVVGIVLLIACANLAALLLARAAAQSREIAVRLALGATRARLARHLLTHCLLLSLAGAAAGVLLARWGTVGLVTRISTRSAPVFLDLSPDWRVLAFTAAVAIVTGMLFGILPAFRSTRLPLTVAMRGSSAAHTGRRGPLRQWIVGAQVALALVLLVTAGLFLRSFAKLVALDPGFDRENLLLVTADLSNTRIEPDRRFATFDAMYQRLRGLPGVLSVAHSHMTPLGNMRWNDSIRPDTPNPPAADADAYVNFVSPGYFAVLRTPLLAGRDFTPQDGRSAPAVAIVNQAYARKMFPSLNPVGRSVRVDQDNGEPGPPIQVVAVVANAKYMSLREEMPPTVYFPLAQMSEPAMQDTFEIRAVGAASLAPAVETAVAEVSREIPLQFTTLAEQVDDSLVQERLLAMLSAFFGGIALALAVVGLYGTVSYAVARRQAEFGIRMALGAQVWSIVRLVLREVALIVGAGVAAGVALALVATRTLEKLLFGLHARDAVTIAGAACLLAAVALLAGYAPARRAARVDPMVALRYE